jgi:hypothetical protein
MKTSTRWTVAITAALCLGIAQPAWGQDFPKITSRQFVAGSAKIQVTGAFTINEDVAVNTQASYGDGEVTWLQFGASGSDKPNATITYGETREIGITVGRGKLVATGGITPGEKSTCTGKVEVTPTLVSGTYTCHGVSSFDPETRKQGKVDVEIRFTAKS